ncbi:hypothetical protein [Sphingobium nicotianae]|uniref:Uncharacterized protein n=1 Tax=Sphingobium nicotianae TaxID=2782607 RepID=A0A9X1AJL4_9SPHN|nr:hypothetical protein [Sphingobium nicotianae]MBT2185698.1 hypothetical protein [Sphingobium nicotianae]
MSGSENPTAEPRGAASLTASLLARRGGARPAMRRAPLGAVSSVTPINDDLGWNDMGEDEIEEAVAPAPVSPINQQLAALADRINAKMADKPRSKSHPATLTGTARKAAFTLRIDTERHLRLRLLSAVSNRSAQQLLTEALDALIARNDELNRLADQAEASHVTPDLKWGS